MAVTLAAAASPILWTATGGSDKIADLALPGGDEVGLVVGIAHFGAGAVTCSYGGVALTQVGTSGKTTLYELLDLSGVSGDDLNVSGGWSGTHIVCAAWINSDAGLAQRVDDATGSSGSPGTLTVTLDPGTGTCASYTISQADKSGGYTTGDISAAGSGESTMMEAQQPFSFVAHAGYKATVSASQGFGVTVSGALGHGIYVAGALYGPLATILEPEAMEAEAEMPEPTLLLTGDTFLGPFLMEAEAEIPAGLLLDTVGPLQVALVGEDKEVHRHTTGGTEGDVLTYHEGTQPSWGSGGGGGSAATTTYDDTSSPGLGDDVQEAIDNLYAVHPHDLDDLADVNAPSPADGNALVWDATPGEWVPGSAGAALRVQDESDTESEDPTDTLIFPDGTVHPNGDGSVSIFDVPVGLIAARSKRTSGNLTLNSTSWADIDTGLDLVLSGVAAGDVLLILLSGLWGNEAVVGCLDVATLVSGSPVNYISGGGGASDQGVQAWRGDETVQNENAAGGIQYVVQAGDLSGSTVTLRLRYRTTTAANKTLLATTALPLHFAAHRLGSGNVAGLPSARARRTSGVITVSSTSWADVDNTLDLTVPAQVGDVLLIAVTGLSGTEARAAGLDVVTVVSGSPVNSVSGSGSGDYGFMYLPVSAEEQLGGTVQYVVQSGDISGGNVTLRLRAKVSSAGNKTIYAGTGGNPQFNWSVVNLRGGAASRDIGYEFAYAEFTSDVTISGTTAAGATTIVTAPSFVADGNTRMCIEFYSSEMYYPGQFLSLAFWDGSTSLGIIAVLFGSGAAGDHRSGGVFRFFHTPAAGSRQYIAKGHKNGGTVTVDAGAGGAGTKVPGYIRVTKA